jgi:hypothetical protein
METLWKVLARTRNLPSVSLCDDNTNGKMVGFLRKSIPPVQKKLSFLYMYSFSLIPSPIEKGKKFPRNHYSNKTPKIRLGRSINLP